MRYSAWMALVAAVLSLLCSTPALAADTPDLRGAWRPETYRLKGGAQHSVTGLLFFGDKDWSVLFFILDKDGARPLQGSGEGGVYRVEGKRLTFTHLYRVAGGQPPPGVPASSTPLTVRAPGAKDAVPEVCDIELEGDRLAIHFPSGNVMSFRRSR